MDFMPIRRALSMAVCALTIAGALVAHHSFAMYDRDHQVTLSGTVTKFEWTNPHAYIELDVPDNNGIVKHYSIECASINVLTRIGWKFNDLKPGEKATLLVNPLKNGKAGGMLEKATLPDGRTLGDGNPPSGRFDRQ
jgi:hypothetical protein